MIRVDECQGKDEARYDDLKCSRMELSTNKRANTFCLCVGDIEKARKAGKNLK